MLRNTSQMTLIYSIICSMYHPTAQEVFNKIDKLNLNISRGTVFRNINKLTKMDRLIKISHYSEADRYDANIHYKHSHLKCKVCGSINDIEYVNMSIPKDIKEKYCVDEQNSLLYGVCRNCFNETERME